MKLRINYRSALSIFNTIIFILLLFAAQQAQAATLTVTNTNDTGSGSLRLAISIANSTTTDDTIEFNIAGGGVHTITPATFLPVIQYGLTIDGTTQPGYAGVPLIEINAVNVNNGLHFTQQNTTATSFVVRGLIINRAIDDGIYVQGFEENPTTIITGCYIGTNSSGTTDLGNGANGISIDGGAATIGGTASGQRNVISGNNRHGIGFSVFSDNIIEIYNNYIGTNAAGTGDLGNTWSGILVTNGTAVIGGTAPGSGANRGNVISGNNENGIHVAGEGTRTIQRNLIGTNAAGTGDLGNSQNGILLETSLFQTGNNNQLIGSSANSLNGNVISGNGGDVNNGNGIKIMGNVDRVQIFGNRIGTNSAGTAVLQNDSDGIEINDSNDNQIGLAGNSTARNTIAGNNLHGIVLSGAGSTGNLIQNNYIGTNSSGTDLGNGGDGIIITSVAPTTAGLNVIGGATANAGNTIAFNDNGHGVNIATASTGNTVQNNTIYLNTGNGVHVTSASNGNAIRQNALYSNQGLGINLGGSGVTPNDLNDADPGANNLQNFPVLQKATPSRIVGTLNSLANQNFTIDFYRVDSCDASGNGEGRYYLASTNIATVGNNAAFNFAYAGLTVGQVVTATATDASGNTSEFSQCLAVTPDSGDFRFAQAGYFTSENNSSVLITVNRMGGTNGTITVDYATANDTATSAQDYTATSGTLTFLDGETTKTFSVPITDDNSDEPNESFNVALSNPTLGSLLLVPSQASVTITDNDNPPTITITDVQSEEGNSGTTNFIFTVNISAASGFDVSVNYATANGTATAGIDYTSANGTLNFSSALAETSKTATVTVSGDLMVEINETFFVNLSNPVNATIADAQGIGTILDDDNPGRLQFGTSPYTGAEGTSVLVTVTRTGGDAGTVSVDYYTTGGSAAPTIDYTPASATLVFNDGETSKSFSVAVLQDTQVEPTENFNIVLSNPLGGATLGALSTTNVNLLDDDGGTLLSIGGRILKTDNTPLVGATVNLQGTQTATTTTNATGDFTFDNLAPNGNFTVTPSALGFTFNPISRTYLSLTANVANANFTATATPTRQMRVVGGDTSPGNPVNAIVELTAQGDENSIGFSLNFDSTVLSNPNVVLNADASTASLTTNSSQTGKLGVLLALPAGQAFTVGTRSLVTVTFNTTVTTAYSSPVTFGDAPIVRQIANTNADPLPTNYVNGQVTFAQGYEADVAPRPTGSNNGTVTVSDFTQIGRFVAGLDTPNQLNEFQRADSAPRISKGNGTLTVSDYTQAGRYAAGLDVVQTAGGETAPSGLFDCGFGIADCGFNNPKSKIQNPKSEFLGGTVVRVVNTSGSPNTQVLVSIETVANGDENGFGFSLSYDATKLSNPLVSRGADTQNASLIPNTNTAGRVGVILGMPFGQAIPAGTRQLVTIRFDIAANASGGQTPLTFGDQPVVREVSDTNGNPVQATFENGNINILGPTAAAVSVGGRVLTTDGRGVSKALVTLTDPNGATRTAITNPFGYYRFDEVRAGETYIFSVSHKRYRFPTQILTVNEELAELNFTAER